jgi:hypothetical protein
MFFCFVLFALIRTFAPEMTPQEYVQLKAFARQDGALLSLLWIGGFICYIQGLTNPLLAMVSVMLVVASPFYAANRLRHFRDYARDGLISFLRGYAYMILIFFYAGLLLAVVLFVYFNFIDQGYLIGKFTEIMATEESRQALSMYGLTTQMEEALKEMASLRPIDFAVNMLTINIITGFFLGIPVAAIMQRVNVKNEK